MNDEKKHLVLVSGASGALGKVYVSRFARLPSTEVIGITRKVLEPIAEQPYQNIGYLTLDLEDGHACEEKLSVLSLECICEVLFIHPVGKFKFEECKPAKDEDADGIDEEVMRSNYDTFVNGITPVVRKIAEEQDKGITLTMCGFGSISDKYNIPFWRSYTQSKNRLRKYMRNIVLDKDTEGCFRALFINVSTTHTDNESVLRPHADRTYWLTPEEIADRSVSYLLNPVGRWQEIEIYKKAPWFTPGYYTNLPLVLERWKREMGRE